MIVVKHIDEELRRRCNSKWMKICYKCKWKKKTSWMKYPTKNDEKMDESMKIEDDSQRRLMKRHEEADDMTK